LALSTNVAEGGSGVFGLAFSTDVALVLAAATFRLCGVGGEERAREKSSLIERAC